jgi:hypothetical protein
VTEGLLAAGHEVTLRAPARSRTSALLIETVPEGVGFDLTEAEKTDHFLATGRLAYEIGATLGADIVHDHSDYAPDPRLCRRPF